MKTGTSTSYKPEPKRPDRTWTGESADLFEDEDNPEYGDHEPYDAEKIRVDSKAFSVYQVVDMIDHDELDLAPEFQRRNVWTDRQKTRLIESLLLRIPLPAFYFAADEEGTLHVIDGVQRLSTIFDYVKGSGGKRTRFCGGFTLQENGLDYRGDFKGKYFEDLEPKFQRRVTQTQLYVNVIDPQTPEQVRYDIFDRINTGGTPLNPQELRYRMSKERSRLFLKRLANLPEFENATIPDISKHKRMADLEMVLRFCAFRLVESIDTWNYHNIDAFLRSVVSQIDDPAKIPDQKLNRLESDFRLAMSNTSLIFGEHAFRKWPHDDERKKPLNKPLFESLSVLLCDYQPDDLVAHKDQIVTRFRRAMAQGEAYERSLTIGTQSVANVRTRFQEGRRILQECLDVEEP